MKFINDTSSNTTFNLYLICLDIRRMKFILIFRVTSPSFSISSPWISQESTSSMILFSNTTFIFRLISSEIPRTTFINDTSSNTTFTFNLISFDIPRMKFINDTSSNTTFTFHLISLDIRRMKFINDTSSNTTFTFHLVSFDI